MAVSSAGLGLESDCSGEAQKQLYSKLQSRPLVREGTQYHEIRNCQTGNSQELESRSFRSHLISNYQLKW
jgi:hypothetical protein